MKKHIFLTGVAFAVAGILSASALAQAPAAKKEGPFVCEKLKDEKAYDKKRGYRVLVDALDGTIFRSMSDFKMDFQIKSENLAYFKMFKDLLAANGTQLMVAMPPTRGIMMSNLITPEQITQFSYDPNKAFASYLAFANRLREYGVPVTDYSDMKPPVANYFYKRDHHWTPDGAKDSAARVAKIVMQMPVYKDIPKITYKTEQAGPGTKPGSFAQFVDEACGGEIPREPMTKFETAAADGDLFDAVKKPHVALVGTSNCTDEAVANYPGWLRQSLSADVDNFSIGGGGIDTPILSYLTSGEYAKNPPKVMIWEMASHNHFTKEFLSIFRQAIPTLKGVCDGKELFKESVSGADKITLYDGKTPITVENGYLHMDFESQLKGKLTITAMYDGAGEKTYQIARDTRFKPSSEYFYLLDGAPMTKLKSLTLTLHPSDKGAKVKASMCPM